MIPKTLQSIVLAGTLVLTSCYGKVNDGRYNFKGQIGDEKVEFTREKEVGFGTYDDKLTLKVTLTNGNTMVYRDFSNDLRIDRVEMNGTGYINDAVGKKALQAGQKQFDSYLAQIIRQK